MSGSAQLRAHAEALREVARKLRSRAAQADTLLDDVAKLNNDQTWRGQVADEFSHWLADLARRTRSAHDDMAETAALLSSTADDFDTRADADKKDDLRVAERSGEQG